MAVGRDGRHKCGMGATGVNVERPRFRSEWQLRVPVQLLLPSF